MHLSVAYNGPFVDQICKADGHWLVTTHNHHIVKAQRVEDTEAGIPEKDPAPGAVFGLGLQTLKTTQSQSSVLSDILADNAQWVVSVSGGAMISASRVQKPESPPRRRRTTKSESAESQIQGAK